MLRYLSKSTKSENSKEKHIIGLIAYRKAVNAEIMGMMSLPLRTARFHQSGEANTRNLVSIDYIVSLRLAIYHHKLIVEKQLMQYYLKILGIS